ncbi:MAG: CxxC-x17-CxxC domain-containing protein [Patescibacteria group bacterium]
MYKTQRDNYSGGSKFGNKKFGGNAPWKRDSRDQGDKPSFRATCAQCNESCMVPFRPNGSKPVLCSNCFKREGGGRDSHFEPKRFDGSRKTYTAPGQSSGGHVEAELKAINSKLDKIIIALDALELE